MRVRVHVENVGVEGKVLPPQEYRIDAATPLTFGRAADQNRLALPDERRMVSSRHGCIELRSDGLWVVDLGSRNGTTLDGQAVDGAGVKLADGNVITVGDFRLRVEFVVAKAQGVESGDSKVGQTIVHFDTEHQAAEAWEAACQQFNAGRELLPAQRREMMLDGLRQRLGDLLPKQARSVLKRLLARAGARAPEPEPTKEEELDKLCADGLRSIGKKLVDGKQFANGKEVARFVELVGMFFDLTTAWLAQTMRARAQFEGEFGAEVTMVFDRSSNPLKHQEPAELAKSLLDWSLDRDVATVRSQLEGVYRDLTQHQLGLLVGVKEAIAAVMERLAPDNIEAAAQKDAGWLSSKGAKAWELYRTIYRDFLQEKSKLFHEVISPAIRQGYLGAHDGGEAGAQAQQ